MSMCRWKYPRKPQGRFNAGIPFSLQFGGRSRLTLESVRLGLSYAMTSEKRDAYTVNFANFIIHAPGRNSPDQFGFRLNWN